jgi:hypothetical protein
MDINGSSELHTTADRTPEYKYEKAVEFAKLIVNNRESEYKRRLVDYTLESVHDYLRGSSPTCLIPVWRPRNDKESYQKTRKLCDEAMEKFNRAMQVCQTSRREKEAQVSYCLKEQQRACEEANARIEKAQQRAEREMEEYRQACIQKRVAELSKLREAYKELQLQMLDEKQKQYEDEDDEWQRLLIKSAETKKWTSIEEFANTTKLENHPNVPVSESTKFLNPPVSDEEIQQSQPEIQPRAINIKNKVTSGPYTIVHINQNEIEMKLVKFREIAAVPQTSKFLRKTIPITPAQEPLVCLKQILDFDDVVWIAPNI